MCEQLGLSIHDFLCLYFPGPCTSSAWLKIWPKKVLTFIVYLSPTIVLHTPYIMIHCILMVHLKCRYWHTHFIEGETELPVFQPFLLFSPALSSICQVVSQIDHFIYSPCRKKYGGGEAAKGGEAKYKFQGAYMQTHRGLKNVCCMD